MHVECGNGGGDASALPEWISNFAVFEKEVNYFRRYAAAAIRDRRTQPLPICDAVPELPELDPVERGYRMFLRVCEEGTVVAEEEAARAEKAREAEEPRARMWGGGRG